jgi:2-dehydropantoate 2-reductase
VHGEDVTFIARGDHLDVLRSRGLRVCSQHGDFHVPHVAATADASDVGPADVVMFCVKMWDTETAGEAARPLVGPNTAVISFQNGVHNEDALAPIFGREHVMGGVAYVTSRLAEPGVIEQTSTVARLVFGELDGLLTPRAEAFHRACLGAGIDAQISQTIGNELWTKFVYICAFSGVGSVARSSIGPILRDPDTREMFIACMREVEAVARAKGVELDPEVVSKHLALADAFGPGPRSSMLDDLERGNRLEVEWLNGAVARWGRELGIGTPVNQLIYGALKLHAGGRPPADRTEC